ncbi:hypothetical protein SBA_ch1_30510 [Sphingomonas bisphenolicum]|uniref:Uncharacterized protein n=1 Tax=Sphingomonas bisphenolicum TaxID=296544 RepID=A0ABM7G735_9SPHN|nr:hypothetical protein SBA_ch1_30510 [Sphingomonas bisphenolicum]
MLRIDQYQYRTAARFHRRDQRRQQRLDIAAAAQIDQGHLRFAMQITLRRILRSSCANSAPAGTLRGLA